MHKLVDIYNKNDYKTVHSLLLDNYDYDKFQKTINIMYDKNTIKDIYYLYYSGNNYDLNEFYNTYNYSNKNININDISFYKKGKTNYFSRGKELYENVTVYSQNGKKSTIGVLKNIKLEIDNGSTLTLDNEVLNCRNNECLIDKIYGGLHEIQYVNNDITYYGLLNIVKNEEKINISGLDSLVKINHKDELKTINEVDNKALLSGVYKIDTCYKKESCGNTKKSYIKIYPDKKIEVYIYNKFEVAGDYYYGIYNINGEYIIMSFNNHTYSAYDYDSKKTTNITTEINISKKYKIIDSKTIKNEDYMFRRLF